MTLSATNPPQKYVADVPCGDCHLCCSKGTVVFIMPWEDRHRWQTDCVPHPADPTIAAYTLPKDENDDCIYLDRGKCSIHGRAPEICEVYDCAATYKLHGHHQSKQRMSPAIRKRARVLLKAGHKPGPVPDWFWETIPVEHVG